jgi:hypothetical protein
VAGFALLLTSILRIVAVSSAVRDGYCCEHERDNPTDKAAPSHH